MSIPEAPLQGHVVGVDVGLEYFLSTSDGLQVERPQFFVEMQRKLFANGSQNAPGEVLAGDVLHPSQDSVNGESLAIYAVLAG